MFVEGLLEGWGQYLNWITHVLSGSVEFQQEELIRLNRMNCTNQATPLVGSLRELDGAPSYLLRRRAVKR